MSDSRKAFEASTADRFPGLDLSLEAEGDYDDLDAQQHWSTWQASRQALSSCPEIPDSLEPDSRQALEGEPVLWWDENDVWDLDECVKKTPTSRHTIPLYTHPASRHALKGESDPVLEVECECGDFYRANSFGAGFIVGTGMCENCAAITCAHSAKESKGRIEGDKSGYGRIADPALQGEAVGTARRCGYDRDITYCDFEADEVPIGTKLYTHPASAVVREEKRKSFHQGQTELMAQFCLLINEMLEGDLKERCGLLEPWNSTHERLKTRLASMASAVPEGWKLVPVEPSNDMQEAGCQGYMEADGNFLMHISSMGHAYKAMISASPCVSQSTKSSSQTDLQRTDERPDLGQRKAAQVGKTIGVLAQNEDGEVCAVTDLGRVTWLPNDVVAPPKQEKGQ